MNQRALDGDRIFVIPEFLTPEECASFSSRTYRWQDMKLALIKRVLAAQLSRRFERLDAIAG